MAIGHELAAPPVEIACGSAFELLVGLAAASAGPRAELPSDLAGALDGVGDSVGETWLNLLGVPLDLGAPYEVERLVPALAALDAVELRRHLLGRYAWSWCTIAGTDDLDAAAAGAAGAAARLLALPRYYGGHSDEALSVVLALDPAETRERVVRAVATAARTLRPAGFPRAERVAADALSVQPPLDAIERLTRGFRYVPEPEAERVILIPHRVGALPLVLAQHRSARLIAYAAEGDRDSANRLLALGRALSDPKRIEILGLVGQGIGSASDLVRETELSRSTVHHHLAQLRDAGLVTLEGNARSYTYVARPTAAKDAAALVTGVLGTKEEE